MQANPVSSPRHQAPPEHQLGDPGLRLLRAVHGYLIGPLQTSTFGHKRLGASSFPLQHKPSPSVLQSTRPAQDMSVDLHNLRDQAAKAVVPNIKPNDITSKLGNLSKGLDIWTYLEDPVTVELVFRGSHHSVTRDYTSNFSTSDSLTHVEFGLADETADLFVKVAGATIKQFSIEVGVILPSLDTDIPPVRDGASIRAQGYAISIGIYENISIGQRHQLFLNVTKLHTDWMGTLPGYCPFWVLCLPGAHDAGCNTLEGLDEIGNNLNLLAPFLAAFKLSVLTGLDDVTTQMSVSTWEKFVIWLGGLTQKDTTTAMLEMGTRFFDFRPGFSVQPLPALGMTEIRHQHAVVPGQQWKDFLVEIFQFLAAHPKEIVQVSVTSNGFVNSAMVPSASDLAQVMSEARQVAGVGASIGCVGPEVFSQTLDQLWSSNNRLILTDSNHGPGISNLDAWNPTAWATVDPQTLKDAYIAALTPNNQIGKDETVYQAQGTATDKLKGPAVLLANDYNLPLVRTKGNFNAVLLPYIRDVHSSTLNHKEHLVLLDDWVDGCLTDVAISITLDRLGRMDKFVPN
ncbi:hypothetical protein JAAARDRAFT_573095 [Jaapia argillacea MUCL 33604]|uniref:Uncharacterized protein n=1 Tax=Jaapia argillacea MUCL 33604 TaxID=933084 RepID=A0A067Q4M7_9AGAM|nr:hypothetical protein JAAARDRAFT_573095 [Jaapia argillacea MUCL 33604]